MSNAYLLDTVTAIGLLNGNPEVGKIIDQADEVYVSVVTIGELYFGAENSARVAANLQKVSQFAARYAVLLSDLQTAREYGRITHQLRVKGRPSYSTKRHLDCCDRLSISVDPADT